MTITITEREENDGYVYDVAQDGNLKHSSLFYDDALEAADKLGRPIEIIYSSGNRPSFEKELQAKRKMDAKGWGRKETMLND